MKIQRTTLEIYIVTLVTGSIILSTMMAGHVLGLFVFVFWMVVAAVWLVARKRIADKRGQSSPDDPTQPKDTPPR